MLVTQPLHGCTLVEGSRLLPIRIPMGWRLVGGYTRGFESYTVPVGWRRPVHLPRYTHTHHRPFISRISESGSLRLIDEEKRDTSQFPSPLRKKTNDQIPEWLQYGYYDGIGRP